MIKLTYFTFDTLTNKTIQALLFSVLNSPLPPSWYPLKVVLLYYPKYNQDKKNKFASSVLQNIDSSPFQIGEKEDFGEIFSDQLLTIGNGKLPDDSISGRIQLAAEFCNLVTSKNELVEKVYPSISIITNYKNHKWLSERAILAAKNKDVHEINNIILAKIPD